MSGRCSWRAVQGASTKLRVGMVHCSASSGAVTRPPGFGEHERRRDDLADLPGGGPCRRLYKSRMKVATYMQIWHKSRQGYGSVRVPIDATGSWARGFYRCGGHGERHRGSRSARLDPAGPKPPDPEARAGRRDSAVSALPKWSQAHAGWPELPRVRRGCACSPSSAPCRAASGIE